MAGLLRGLRALILFGIILLLEALLVLAGQERDIDDPALFLLAQLLEVLLLLADLVLDVLGQLRLHQRNQSVHVLLLLRRLLPLVETLLVVALLFLLVLFDLADLPLVLSHFLFPVKIEFVLALQLFVEALLPVL